MASSNARAEVGAQGRARCRISRLRAQVDAAVYARDVHPAMRARAWQRLLVGLSTAR